MKLLLDTNIWLWALIRSGVLHAGRARVLGLTLATADARLLDYTEYAVMANA